MVTLRKRGLNASISKGGLPKFKRSLEDHARLLETTFDIKLYIFAHDEEADDARGNPKNRLSVLPLYTPKSPAKNTVHLLLTNETDDTTAAYSHAHLILKPETTCTDSGAPCATRRTRRRDGWARTCVMTDPLSSTQEGRA